MEISTVLKGLIITMICIAMLPCWGIADDYSGGDILSLQSQSDLPDYAEGRILVKTETGPEGTVQALSDVSAEIGAIVEEDYSSEGFDGLALVSLPANMSVQDGVSFYDNKPGVAYAEPDYYRYITAVPQDPEFWREWGMQNTGQVYRENISPGTPGVDIHATDAWNYQNSSKTIIAVLDTGVDYNHPDLASNIWTDPATGTHGYNAISGTNDPMDGQNHGTHCAGIAGAVANNGIGGSGVVWNASLMPVRWINSMGIGSVSDEISAILWAERNGAKIISCSYGKTSFSQAEKDAIAGSNALFVISAGNNNGDNDLQPVYPASYDLPNIISVAALDPDNNLGGFSNYGKKTVHLAAPGTQIYSTTRSIYTPSPIWYDPFNSLANWTITGNWTLDNTLYVSPPSSVKGSDEGQIMLLTLNNPLNLTGLQNPVISYQVISSGQTGTVILEGSYNGGSTWNTIDTCSLSYTDMAFTMKQAELPASLFGESVLIRFRMEGRGFVILDDLMISDGYGSLTTPRWGYMNGTSMAVPMVAGSAGLLAAYAPDAGITDIKEAILSGTDPVPSLQNKLVTGGRLNLTSAMKHLTTNTAIPIKPGWNFVSVPKEPAPGYETARIFAGINSSGHSVLSYKDDATGWKTLTADDRIQPLNGYWIYSMNATEVAVVFKTPVIGSSRQVVSGWNSISGWAENEVPADKTLSSLGSNWSYLVGYDASSQQYEEVIMRGGTGNMSDKRPVKPWHGYWLYATANTTYQGPLT
ncbi:MAG: S8 family serine peptidase [Methanospirillum sp.]|nr:S8 family serine peptidase [Methanospirillum sp.]